MNKPKVSVILPNYNHAPFLKERIDSILHQTFQDFELIILDDNSQDNSREIIESYGGHPLISRMIFNRENSGSTFAQWEKGIALSSGDYIWIAESDDVAETTFLEEMLCKIESKQGIVLAYCNSKVIDRDGIETGTTSTWEHRRDWNTDFYNSGKSEIKEHLLYLNTIQNASAALFRKSAIAVTAFDQSRTMRYAGDWLFWIKLLEAGDIAYTARKLNYFRRHDLFTVCQTFTSEPKKRQLYAEHIIVLLYVLKNHICTCWIFKQFILIMKAYLYSLLKDGLKRVRNTFDLNQEK